MGPTPCSSLPSQGHAYFTGAVPLRLFSIFCSLFSVLYSLICAYQCQSVVLGLPCTITVQGRLHFSQYGFTECLHRANTVGGTEPWNGGTEPWNGGTEPWNRPYILSTHDSRLMTLDS